MIHTQAQQAGPGHNRRSLGPVSVEAAGPASPPASAKGARERAARSAQAPPPAAPRLLIEEVKVRVGADSRAAEVTLSAGARHFTGSASGRSGATPVWQLAAAATVAAIQQCLQQCTAAVPAPQIQLVHVATVTPAAGREAIQATLELAHDSQQTRLLGSALVRNDRCSTAVAAALDAANRRLALLALTAPVPMPKELLQVPETTPPEAEREASLVSEARDDPPSAEPPPAEASEPLTPQLTEMAPEEPSPPASIEQEEPALAAVRSETESRNPAMPVHVQAASGSEASASALALGVEISPTSVRAAAVDAEGHILAEARRPSRASAEVEVTLGMALEAARTALASLDSSGHGPAAVGVAAPGRLRLAEGVCISCGDFPAWREVQLAGPFEEEFHLPVSLIGTTQAAALAETRFAAARDLSGLVFVRVGIEIDVAVILDGRPLSFGEAAPGHAGHMVIHPGGPRCECGESGCWQALAGREALVSRVVKDIGGGASSAIAAAVGNRLGAITPALICRMASAGDAVARNALEETGRYLAVGLGNLIALFDPEAIIVDAAPPLVGAALGHAAESALKTSRRAHLLSRCVLLSPALGDSAPVLGAAAWAGQHPH